MKFHQNTIKTHFFATQHQDGALCFKAMRLLCERSLQICHLCPYGHAIKQLLSLKALASAISSISIWHMKTINGSHDGFWRLWKPQILKDGGKDECIMVASIFLFCGFEAVSSSGDSKFIKTQNMET